MAAAVAGKLSGICWETSFNIYKAETRPFPASCYYAPRVLRTQIVTGNRSLEVDVHRLYLQPSPFRGSNPFSTSSSHIPGLSRDH